MIRFMLDLFMKYNKCCYKVKRPGNNELSARSKERRPIRGNWVKATTTLSGDCRVGDYLSISGREEVGKIDARIKGRKR